MGENSRIEWTDHTFNPWTGCTKVSPGCANCYAESWSKRSGLVEWGDNGTRRRTSEAKWKEPLKWNRDAAAAGERRKVFCASLADVFEEREELQPWRLELFELIHETAWLDWLLLTKRPAFAAQWLLDYRVGLDVDEEELDPFLNLWLGTSVENQDAANERVLKLLDAPAAVHFLSCEPLLGPVDLTSVGEYDGRPVSALINHPCVDDEPGGVGIDWVIVGGESGPRSRRLQVEWVRDLREQCRAAGVACFVKQLGAKPVDADGNRVSVQDPKGGVWDQWPHDLRVREFPVVNLTARA